MFYLLSLISLFLTRISPESALPVARLQVDIHNITSRQGTVFIALFKSGGEFPDGRPLDGKKVEASATTVHATFSVEPGNYAIALFHDLNGNGKMDKNLFGIPKEPYGLSNNVRPRFSGPKFRDCQFSVSESGRAVSIDLEKF